MTISTGFFPCGRVVRFGLTKVGRGWDGSSRILIHESFCGSVGGTSKPLCARLQWPPQQKSGLTGSAYHLKPRLADDAAAANEISPPVPAGEPAVGLTSLGLPSSPAGVVAREELLGVL